MNRTNVTMRFATQITTSRMSAAPSKAGLARINVTPSIAPAIAPVITENAQPSRDSKNGLGRVRRTDSAAPSGSVATQQFASPGHRIGLARMKSK